MLARNSQPKGICISLCSCSSSLSRFFSSSSLPLSPSLAVPILRPFFLRLLPFFSCLSLFSSPWREIQLISSLSPLSLACPLLHSTLHPPLDQLLCSYNTRQHEIIPIRVEQVERQRSLGEHTGGKGNFAHTDAIPVKKWDVENVFWIVSANSIYITRGRGDLRGAIP